MPSRVLPSSSCECYVDRERVEKPFLLDNISSLANKAIQDLSQWLYHKGWVIGSYLTASLIGEPLETIKASLRIAVSWQSALGKQGIIDAANQKELNSFKVNGKVPVILLHGVYATPHTFIPWAPYLKAAVDSKEIGPVLTLQLDNDLEKRMKQLYKVIEKVCRIQQDKGIPNPQVDLIGHSLGGYAAHLAMCNEDQITIRDEKGIERRWHSIKKEDRNPQVRKVISVAAATWNCVSGQTNGKNDDIYPPEVFTRKDIESAYPADQLKAIRESHEDCYDFVGTFDALSATVSPLHKKYVYSFTHKHLGILTCPKVCRKAIDILKI